MHESLLQLAHIFLRCARLSNTVNSPGWTDRAAVLGRRRHQGSVIRARHANRKRCVQGRWHRGLLERGTSRLLLLRATMSLNRCREATGGR